MSSGIRRPTRYDVSAILDLAELKREEYQRYQPTFWRKAGDSRDQHRPFLERLIDDQKIVALVHETDGKIDAFAIASILSSPPVYDPGGTVCLLDDFATIDAMSWSTAGTVLLEAVTSEAKRLGATLMVVITAHLDHSKREMLARAGYAVASEWHIRDL